MPKYLRSRAIAVGAAIALMVGLFSLDYTVQRGDNLARIAYEHGVSIADIVEANNISNPNLIYVGQVLVIPGEEGEPDTVHVVQRGETLGKIAAKYDTSVTALVERNEISNPNLIRIGQSIVISGAGSSGGSGGSSGAGDSTSKPSSDPSVRSGAFHVVKRGESIHHVGRALGVPGEQVARANGILNGVIYAGTRLFADGPSYTPASSKGDSTYTVQRGDSLSRISSKTGVSASKIAEANGISNPNLIRIGQELVLPGGGAGWVCPVARSVFFNDWGFPRGGGTRWHEGNDLFAPLGTEVRAPVSGTVQQKRGSIGGLQANLKGDDGVLYIGSHLNAYGKSGRVSAGDVIGYVGNTGNAVGSSPHLHFGMYYKGVAINPYPTLISSGCR